MLRDCQSPARLLTPTKSDKLFAFVEWLQWRASAVALISPPAVLKTVKLHILPPTIYSNLIKNLGRHDNADRPNKLRNPPGGRRRLSRLLPEIGNSHISIDHGCPSMPLLLHQCPLPNSRTYHIGQLLKLSSIIVALSCPFSCSPLARRTIRDYAGSGVRCPSVLLRALSTRRYRVGQFQGKVLMANTHCCVTSSERTCWIR
jgi:hypothetical protein